MYEVISLQEKVRWQAILESMQITDIYYSCQYFISALQLDPGEAFLFYYTDTNGEVAYPFIKRALSGKPAGYFDITTPFGYGGPATKGIGQKNSQSALVSKFREEFSSFCMHEKIAAEFIRFHPLYENALPFERHLKLMPFYKTFTRKLDSNELSPERLENQGITVKKLGTVRHLFDFLVLYYSEIRRREDADSYYFFTDDYFEALVKALGSHLHLFGAFYGDKLIAASYVIAKGSAVYHHLEGSLQSEETSEAKKMLLLKIMEWATENQFIYFHLGSDYKGDLQKADKIKEELANLDPNLYYIGEKIHDFEIYDKLVDLEEMDTVKRYRNL